MTNALLGWDNLVETGTLTVGAEEPARPGSSLADPFSGYWQTPAATTTSWFRIDAGQTVAWRAVGIFRTNLSSGAEWRVRLGSTAGDGSAYDSGQVAANVQAGYGQAVDWLAAAVPARWLQVDLIDSGNPDGFLRTAFAFAGPAWEPVTNFQFGWTNGWSDPTQIVTSRGGQEYPVAGPPASRSVDFTLPAVTQSELWGEVGELVRTKGTAGNVLVVPRPDEAVSIVNRESLFGRLTDTSPPAGAGRYSDGGRWSKRFAVRERL